MRRLLIGLVAFLLALSGCADFLDAGSPPSSGRYEDDLGDAPPAHDIAWAAWDSSGPRFEVGLADGSAEGDRLLVSIFADPEEAGTVYISRTDVETKLTYFSDCPECSWEERQQTVPVATHTLEDGLAWTWAPLDEIRLSGDFVVQVLGSSVRGEDDCVHDFLATTDVDFPTCDESSMPRRVPPIPVQDAPACTSAIWNDASLFHAALRMDEGNTSVDHNVTAGLQYVAPRDGLAMARGVVEWPHSVRTLSSGTLEQRVTLYGLSLLSSRPWMDIVAADEDQARQRGRAFLENVSRSDPADFDGWLASLEVTGHVNDHLTYTAKVNGSFRLPDELLDVAPTQDGLRSADLESGDWRASLSLPIYRIRPEHGFIELSPLGDIQASLEPEPSFQEAANDVLWRFGLGPSSFDEFMEFDHFGRGPCGDQTVA